MAAQRESVTALELDTPSGYVTGRVVARLATLLSLLPRLEDIGCTALEPWSGDVGPAQMHSNICALLRACSSAINLRLHFTWRPDLPEALLLEQLPARFPLHLFNDMSSLRSLVFFVRGTVLPPLVSLEGFVSAVTLLTRLRSLRLWFAPHDAEHYLPTCITALAGLRELFLIFIGPLVCAPGWADMPRLETLQISYCEVDEGPDHAFPGITGLLGLSKLVFSDVPTLTRWPSALWRLSRLRVLQHSIFGDDPPPQLALPSACSRLQGLEDLNLAGQGYHSFPATVTQLTALTKLQLQGNSFNVLPAGITVLASLVELALGHHASEPGDLDVRALGCLSTFPRLAKLVLVRSAIVFSADFANAAHHRVFDSLVFFNAFAAAGLSRAAVLVYALNAKEQGRRSALQVTVGMHQQGARDFWVCLEAGGLPREDFLHLHVSEEE